MMLVKILLILHLEIDPLLSEVNSAVLLRSAPLENDLLQCAWNIRSFSFLLQWLTIFFMQVVSDKWMIGFNLNVETITPERGNVLPKSADWSRCDNKIYHEIQDGTGQIADETERDGTERTSFRRSLFWIGMYLEWGKENNVNIW